MPRSREPTEPEGSRIARLRAFLATSVGRALKRGLVFALAVLVVSLVAHQARAAVVRMPAYRIAPEDVQFTGLPALVDARMRLGLVESLPMVWPVPGPSTFSSNLEPSLRDILRGHPMVKSVIDVETRYPRRVFARVAVRMPLAVFHVREMRDGKWAEGDLPVDSEGVVLDPAVYAGFLAVNEVVRIDGIRGGCPSLGQRWIDSDEQVEEALAAARVANRLNSERASIRAPEIVRADVAGFPAPPSLRMKGEVVFVLEDGRSIQWGRTERSLSSVTKEDGYEVKRMRLMDLLADPANVTVRELDVRFTLRRALPPRGR